MSSKIAPGCSCLPTRLAVHLCAPRYQTDKAPGHLKRLYAEPCMAGCPLPVKLLSDRMTVLSRFRTDQDGGSVPCEQQSQIVMTLLCS